MHFTHRTEIALGMLAECARHSGQSLSTQEVANRIGAKKDYIARTASMLARNGLIKRSQGRIWSDADPAEITLGTVLKVTQPKLIRSRTNGKPRKKAGLLFDEVISATQDKFICLAEQHTIADIHL